MRLAFFASFAAAAVGLCLAGSAQAAVIDKQVSIRPIQLCDDAGANCAVATTYEAAADKIWAQGGIDLVFMAIQSWNSTAFRIIDADANEVGAPGRLDRSKAEREGQAQRCASHRFLLKSTK